MAAMIVAYTNECPLLVTVAQPRAHVHVVDVQQVAERLYRNWLRGWTQAYFGMSGPGRCHELRQLVVANVH